ncbi:MAG: ABC transporter ATP-binding protein [Alphaproteobacteria bacterium]|nr:ABC transporter ATP-binding protein [Alphaproteobacteria bacterium]
MSADTATLPVGRKDLVALRDVHLSLPSAAGLVHILRGIDFAVHEGEAVGVLGPSGSGKSTMMAIMAGLERPTRGTVRVDGADLTAMDEDALALFRRRTIGIVFQSFHLIPTMTAIENVAIPLELARDPAAFDKAEQTLAGVGLGHRLTHYPAQMSGGEQQRVALARAFVADPKLLLADEPTGNLDSDTGRAIIDTLFSLRDRHRTTLVLITHEERLARRCDRIVRMRDGLIDRNNVAAAQ